MRQESGDMNKISGLYTRDRFSSFAPANLADARKNVRDRLLFPVMMNACSGPWFDLEQAAPDRGRDTERRRDAARRSEPGVCAVARSNCAGLTM